MPPKRLFFGFFASTEASGVCRNETMQFSRQQRADLRVHRIAIQNIEAWWSYTDYTLNRLPRPYRDFAVALRDGYDSSVHVRHMFSIIVMMMRDEKARPRRFTSVPPSSSSVRPMAAPAALTVAAAPVASPEVEESPPSADASPVMFPLTDGTLALMLGDSPDAASTDPDGTSASPGKRSKLWVSPSKFSVSSDKCATAQPGQHRLQACR